MKIAVIVSRILMGLPLLFFGAAGLFRFMPIPATLPQEESGFPPEAHALLRQLWDSGYLHTVPAGKASPFQPISRAAMFLCFRAGIAGWAPSVQEPAKGTQASNKSSRASRFITALSRRIRTTGSCDVSSSRGPRVVEHQPRL